MKYTEEDIRQILSQPEGETLEFKRLPFRQDIIQRILVAFANTEGGRLVLGYDAFDKTVNGILPGTANRIVTLLSEWSLTDICEVSVVSYEGKQLLIIDVIKSNDLIPFNGGIYKRRGETIYKLSDQDIREHYKQNYLTKSEADRQENDLLLNKLVELTERIALFKDKYDKDQKKAIRNNWLFCIAGAVIGVILSVLYHKYFG